jgi:tripartite-type tricarboxylate transporter receptor subunit TctC
MNKRFLCVLKLVALVVGASATALGEEFYKGKTIVFIAASPPGGGYDIYTRAVARHIGKYIPGNPTPIVQNMVGAGHRDTAQYIYNRAKPDGLTMGVWNSGLVLLQALGETSVKFKADQFGWIGAPHKGFPTCAIMGFTGLRTLKDVLNSKKPIKMGATSTGLPPWDLPRILNLTFGTKFDVIHGYDGTPRIRVALQTREVDGACFGWESMRVIAKVMLDAKGDDKLIPYVTHGDSGDPDVKDLPRFNEVIKDKENLATLNAYLQQFNFMRPFMLPPGTPKERLSILRKAYKATLEDPQFLAEAKGSELVVDYVSGEEIEKFVAQILAISPKTREKLQFLVK